MNREEIGEPGSPFFGTGIQQFMQNNEREWRCNSCHRLLGVVRDGWLHLRFGRGNEYVVAFPALGLCRRCLTLNAATGPPDQPPEEPTRNR